MSAPRRHPLVTEEEFFELPESHDHIELLDGEVILAPAPTSAHQILVHYLSIELGLWARQHRPAFVGLSPFDVRIAPGRVVQPDLFVLLDGLPSQQGVFHGVPGLTIEVLSDDRRYDRLAKRLVYAEAGVKEYWIVDRRRRLIEVVRGLETVAEIEDRLASELLPGFTLDVKALFEDV
ncbi:MAG: Uma2 family endonuclease [Pseudomonadota bacterium]|nr:Uma2 family endonuclease [Pseudomonadota bacterium]